MVEEEIIVIEDETEEEIVVLEEDLEYIEPTTQEKTITPTKEEQVVIPDDNIFALSKVTIEKIPDEYEIVEGSIDIVSNGIYDVANYKEANVKIGDIDLTLDEYTHIGIEINSFLVGKTFTLYFYGTGDGKGENIVDWGDGTTSQTSDSNMWLYPTHIYNEAGNYEIKINGKHMLGGVSSSNRKASFLQANTGYNSSASINSIVKYIKLSNSMTKLGYDGLNLLYSCEYVIIPETVTEIRQYCIGNYANKLIFLGTTPPTLYGSSTPSFQNYRTKYYVPDESVEIYKTYSEYWEDHADFIRPLSEL